METATRTTAVDVYYDKLCAVCRYPIDNQGLCVIDAEHAGVWVPPARQEPKFDRSGLKEACQRALALGRTHQTTDIQLFLDMLLEIERCEHRDPAFQKVVKTLSDLCGFLNVTPLKLNEGDSMTLSMLTDSAREALRLAREGEE